MRVVIRRLAGRAPRSVGNARPLPQFNDYGIGDGKRSESNRRSVRKAEAITSASRLSSLGTGQREGGRGSDPFWLRV